MSPFERVRMWESLFEHPGWKELMGTIEAQRSERVNEIMSGEHTPDNTLQREYIRGEWAGLRLAELYAKTMHEVAVQDVVNSNQENEDAD